MTPSYRANKGQLAGNGALKNYFLKFVIRLGIDCQLYRSVKAGVMLKFSRYCLK